MSRNQQNDSSRRRPEEFRKKEPLTSDKKDDQHWKPELPGWNLEVRVLEGTLEPIRLSEYPYVFKDIPERPETLSLLYLTPEKLDALGRPDRRKTVVALAEKGANIRLWPKDGDQKEGKIRDRMKRVKKERPDQKDKECNLAVATIIALALHCKDGDRRMVSELLALAPPGTMEKFRAICCQSPFMRLDDVPNFVHVVARNVAHDDDGGSDKPIESLRMTAEIIADILEDNENKINLDDKRKTKNLFESAEIFENCLKNWSNGIDRGIQVGLVLAGVRKYFERVYDNTKRNYDVALVLIDTLLAGLTGVPGGGFAFGIGQSLVSYFGGKKKEESLSTVDGIFGVVLDYYYEKVDFPLNRDKMLAIGNQPYSIDVDVFTRWVNLTLKYNTLAQI